MDPMGNFLAQHLGWAKKYHLLLDFMRISFGESELPFFEETDPQVNVTLKDREISIYGKVWRCGGQAAYLDMGMGQNLWGNKHP